MNGMRARPGWDSLRNRSLVASGAAFALCAVGAVIDAQRFFHAYLSAYIFWIGIPLGCWALLMLHHLVGGRWGFVIQRVLESAAQTFPLMAALFLPILFGMPALYPWAQPEALAADRLLQDKAAYLNVPFFIARAAVYFAIWIGASQLLSRWSLEQDRSGDVALLARLQRLSGPGLVLYGLTVTFSAIDWLMSLEPHWYSTIYGMLYMVSFGLAALAFVIIIVYMLENEQPLVRVLAPDRFHDLGNLLLALVMFWAYLNFSQFLLVWAENLAEEIPWYLHRLRGGWQWVALALVIFQFALPFLLLLARAIKCRGRTLALVAAAILFMHWIDMMWLVAPSFHPAQFHIHWLDVAALIGIGGIWLAVFLTVLKARSLLPLRDPRFGELVEGVQEA